MSVLVADLKVYEEVYKKAWNYTFNKVCDINYCHTLGSLGEETLKKHVKNWLYLNELSYIRRYDEGDKPELHNFLNLKPGTAVNTYQTLKYLNCIDYNIEMNTIKNGKTGHEKEIIISEELQESYDLLKKAINEIKDVIISQIPQYKKAKYSTI